MSKLYRTVAAFNSKDDAGHLHAGPESAETSGAEQGGRHDPFETRSYRRSTASFRGNPGSSLIRFASPAGSEPVGTTKCPADSKALRPRQPLI
jgi:hypothetical protein